MSDEITILDGDPPKGERVLATLYEFECSGSTHAECIAALGAKARAYFDQWSRQNDATNCRPALARVNSSFSGAQGRHAAAVHAAMVVLGPARERPRAISDDERRRLARREGPTLADHRHTLTRALARFEAGEPVDTSCLWPSVIALLLSEEA